MTDLDTVRFGSSVVSKNIVNAHIDGCIRQLAYPDLSGIRSTSSTLADLHARLSTRTQILQPSDDPSATVPPMNPGSEMARNDQHATGTDDVPARLPIANARLSTIEDVDIVQTALDVIVANAAYQAALQTAASLRQLSLLEFLR